MILGELVSFKKSVNKSRFGNGLNSDAYAYFTHKGYEPIPQNHFDVGRRFKLSITKHSSLKSGIICGVRNLDVNGYIRHWDSEDGCDYKHGKRIKVYLIACNLSELHYVPRDFIIRKETGVNG